MAKKKLSNRTQGLIALAGAAAIGVFLATRKKKESKQPQENPGGTVAGIGALSSAEQNVLEHINNALEETKIATYAAIREVRPYDKKLVTELMDRALHSLLVARYHLKNK